MKTEMYQQFIENITDEEIMNYFINVKGMNPELAKGQLRSFLLNQDIYDEFKYWYYNSKNRAFHESTSKYDKYALAFDFAVEDPVTEQNYTAHDLAIKFGDKLGDEIPNAIKICNILIDLRERPEYTLEYLNIIELTSSNN